MPRQVATDTIEILGSSTKQAGKQVAQIPFKIIETAGTQITQNTKTQMTQGGESPTQITQMDGKKQADKAQTQKRLTYLEEELRAIRAKKSQEKEVQAKQEEQKKVTAIQQLEVEKKQEIPRLRDVKQKGGTGERRKRGGDR